MRSLFALTLASAISTAAYAQDGETGDPTGERGAAATPPEQMFQPAVSDEESRLLRERPQSPRRYLSNVTVVVDEDGSVHPEWEQRSECFRGSCRNVLASRDGSRRSEVSGEFQPGFMRTGRGEEVIYLAPPEQRFDRRTNQIIAVTPEREEN